MEKTEINLKIPLGYQIIERTKEVDLYSACIILRTRKQKYITTVKRIDDYAVLISHHIKCPYCGKEIPAYSHCWRKESHALPKKTEAEILKWADIQPALFGEKNLSLKYRIILVIIVNISAVNAVKYPKNQTNILNCQ